jgi:hypothetical protein
VAARQQFSRWRKGERVGGVGKVGDHGLRRQGADDNLLGAIGQPTTIRGKGRALRALVAEGNCFIGLAKLPKVAPLEAAQVLLTGLWPLSNQQVERA